MQHKKMIGIILAVFAVVMVIFAVNNSNSNSNKEAYATTAVSKNTNLKSDLKNSVQARQYLNDKFGDAGWQSSSFTKMDNGNDYWTFVALKDNQSGTVRAGHTLYVHVDGSIVY